MLRAYDLSLIFCQILEGKPIHGECYGNIYPLAKSGQQLIFNFYAFKENRLPFNIKVWDIWMADSN